MFRNVHESSRKFKLKVNKRHREQLKIKAWRPTVGGRTRGVHQSVSTCDGWNSLRQRWRSRALTWSALPGYISRRWPGRRAAPGSIC